MVGNGVRMQRITEMEDGVFMPSYAEVRRFRCSGCGATEKATCPETESGFRISKTAAEGIVEAAIANGITRSAGLAGIDPASVSRLVATRADRLIDATTRPNISRLIGADGGVVAVADAWTGDVAACFSGVDDQRLLPWLSRPYPSVVMPTADLMPRVIGWAGTKVSLDVETAISVLGSMVDKARQRLSSVIAAGNLEVRDVHARNRHFLRTSEALHAAMETYDLGRARLAISRWIERCEGFWAEVFSPVLRFLTTYGDCLFNHPVCITPLAHPSIVFSGPANLMTLALRRGPSLDARRPSALEPSGPTLRY